MGMVVSEVTMSIDGYVAGPNQREDAPFGDGMEDEPLHRWMFEDRENNLDELTLAGDGHGAYIMGRNMFGPVRGEWDRDWRGWWGPNPPYHVPVFVLTHYPHEPIEMEGDTTFHFITEGPEEALRLAREAAGDRTVSVIGGANTINQYLNLGAIDELRLHVAPITAGGGARLFDGIGARRYQQVSVRGTDLVTHITYRINP
jgi:dihydrofolate reductase